MTILAAIHHNNNNVDIVSIILLVISLACIAAGAYKLWLRDILIGAILLLVGVLLLAWFFG